MIDMDALRRYGGGLLIGTGGYAAGFAVNWFFDNVAQGKHAYLNNAADTMGDIGFVLALGLGVIGGINHMINYRNQAQQHAMQQAPVQNQQQAPQQQGHAQNPQTPVINIYNNITNRRGP